MMAMSGTVRPSALLRAVGTRRGWIVSFDPSSFLRSGGITATGRTPADKEGSMAKSSHPPSPSWRTEVERPALVDRDGQRHWCAGTQCPLTPAAPAHHEPLFAVQPIELLVVQRVTFARQHPAQAPVPKAPPLGSQLLAIFASMPSRPLFCTGSATSNDPARPARTHAADSARDATSGV